MPLGDLPNLVKVAIPSLVTISTAQLQGWDVINMHVQVITCSLFLHCHKATIGTELPKRRWWTPKQAYYHCPPQFHLNHLRGCLVKIQDSVATGLQDNVVGVFQVGIYQNLCQERREHHIFLSLVMQLRMCLYKIIRSQEGMVLAAWGHQAIWHWRCPWRWVWCPHNQGTSQWWSTMVPWPIKAQSSSVPASNTGIFTSWWKWCTILTFMPVP